MSYKLRTSSYGVFGKIPKDWLCVSLFDDTPLGLKSQNIKNFLCVNASFFSPSKELYAMKDIKGNNEIEEAYLKEVINNFQKWKKTYEGCFSIDVNTFLDWERCFEKSLELFDEDWKGIVFMTDEEDFENSFRKIFVKLMKFNKIEISELKDEDLSQKQSSAHFQKVKELF